jgi:hypothetical protein
MSKALAGKLGNGQQIATVEIGTVDPDGVHLLGAVGGLDVAVGRAPGGSDPDDDHLALATRPLALDAEQLGIQVEDQVVAAAAGQGPGDVDSQFDGGRGELGLGDVSLVAWSEYGRTLGRKVSRRALGS